MNDDPLLRSVFSMPDGYPAAIEFPTLIAEAQAELDNAVREEESLRAEWADLDRVFAEQVEEEAAAATDKSLSNQSKRDERKRRLMASDAVTRQVESHLEQAEERRKAAKRSLEKLLNQYSVAKRIIDARTAVLTYQARVAS